MPNEKTSSKPKRSAKKKAGGDCPSTPCSAFSGKRKEHKITHWTVTNNFPSHAHCSCGATWKSRIEWDLISKPNDKTHTPGANEKPLK
jgi:hypothetical protein